jgi:acetyl esterase/lipase
VHAADFHADAATVGGLGVSSGGHLILLSAMRPFDPRYTALPLAGTNGVDGTLAYAISCWGVLDPLGRYRMAEANGNTQLMANHERYFLTTEAMQESNIIHILQSGEKVELPPALLIQGTADKGVPQGMVEKVAELYRAAGGEVELALFQDMPHGIAGWTESEVKNMIERIKGFIARHLATAPKAMAAR